MPQCFSRPFLSPLNCHGGCVCHPFTLTGVFLSPLTVTLSLPRDASVTPSLSPCLSRRYLCHPVFIAGVSVTLSQYLSLCRRRLCNLITISLSLSRRFCHHLPISVVGASVALSLSPFHCHEDVSITSSLSREYPCHFVTVMGMCLSPFHYHGLSLSPHHCSPISVAVSLLLRHCRPVSFAVSLSWRRCLPVTVTRCVCHLCHRQSIAVVMSLSPRHCSPFLCRGVSIAVTLSSCHCHSVNVTLSQSPCFYGNISVMVSMSSCQCHKVSLSSCHTRHVSVKVSLSPYHFCKITVALSLSMCLCYPVTTTLSLSGLSLS